MESHDVTSAVSLVEREGGDALDDIIDSMVATIASSGDGGEEGEAVLMVKWVSKWVGGWVSVYLTLSDEIEEEELADDDNDYPLHLSPIYQVSVI